MSKQRIEIEVPYGWEAVRYGSPACDEWYQTPDGNVIQATGDHNPIARYLILRRVEPVRETRWLALHNPMCIGWQQRERARQLAGGNKLIRMDIEDGKLVNVALESVEQPLTPSAPPKE